MEQFMTEKGKLITTQFGFLSGQHRRRGAVSVREARVAHLPLLRPERTQVPAFSSFKSETVPMARVNRWPDVRQEHHARVRVRFSYNPGRWDQVLRSEGRVPHREQPRLSVAEETKRGWSPGGIHPSSSNPPRTKVGSFLKFFIDRSRTSHQPSLRYL